MLNFLRSNAARPSVAELAARVSTGEMILVDVRETGEVRASGLAAGAINLPLALVPQRADPRHPDHDKRLSPDRPVALYCASGARSGMAAQVLRRLGYAEVHNLGGLGDWISAGGSVSR